MRPMRNAQGEPHARNSTYMLVRLHGRFAVRRQALWKFWHAGIVPPEFTKVILPSIGRRRIMHEVFRIRTSSRSIHDILFHLPIGRGSGSQMVPTAVPESGAHLTLSRRRRCGLLNV